MRRSKNPTVYNGLVGSKMRPHSIRRPSRVTPRRNVVCLGGPFDGMTIRLASDLYTLVVAVRGAAGRYNGSHWEAA